MNFAHKDADTSKIIKKYTRENYHFYIEYLDGSEKDYDSITPDQEEEKILEKMMQQAIERDKAYNIGDDKLLSKHMIKEAVSFLVLVLSGEIAILSATDKNSALVRDSSLIFTLLGSFAFTRFLDIRRKKKELLKYRMFLELYESNPAITNDPTIYNGIWFDHFDQPLKFNINELDNLTNPMIRTIYKGKKNNKE